MVPSGDIGILTTDRGLVVQSWDEWLEAVTGISSPDARGRRLQDLAPYFDERRFVSRIEETLASGTVQVLSPAFHRSMLPCPPRTPSAHFKEMQQRVTIGPLLDSGRIAGLLITVQDVTPQLEIERDLAAALASDDPEVRRSAADSIAAAQRIESLEHFTPVLSNDDWRVRGDAVRGLASAADRDLLRALLTTLQREHRNFSTLSSALKLLAVTDVDVTEPLAELLQDADADLRIQAALALGEQHQPGAATPLLHALEDPDPNVRFHAIEALGRLRSEAAIEPLLAIVESRDFFLAFAALESLGLIQDSRVAPRLVPLLQDDDLREPVVHALSLLGDEHVVEPLVRALNESATAAASVAQALAAITERIVSQGQDDRDVAGTVREVLSAAGRANLFSAAEAPAVDAVRAVSRVLAWVPGPDSVVALRRIATRPEARTTAVEGLIRHGEAAVDAFVDMLDTDDADVRNTVIAALGTLGSKRATAPLTGLLESSPQTVIAASGALARIGDVAAFEPLLGLVGHENPAVRQAVVGALNSIGHPEMPSRVTALLRHEDPLVRESAVRIAGYFGYPGGLPLVVDRLADPIEEVRVAALEHLPFFDGEPLVPVIGSALQQETPRARAAAARALARVESAEALDLLTAALGDDDQWVRYYAARALGEHRNSVDVPALQRLAEQDPSVPVRIAAIDAIGVRGSHEGVDALVRCAGSEELEVAAAALRALGRQGAPGALQVLRDNSRAPEPARRLAAVEGLGALATTEAVAQLEWIAAAETEGVGDPATHALAQIAAAAGGGASAAIAALIALCAVPERRDTAAASLSSLPDEAIPEVAKGLRHTDPAVRRRTVDVLTRFRRPEATRELSAAFADTDSSVRETAAIAILRLGSGAYDDVLRQLAERDPSKAVRRAASAVIASRRSAR